MEETKGAEATYPSQYKTEVLLKDGLLMSVRPIKEDDMQAWCAFLDWLSSQTKYLRFHHIPKKWDRRMPYSSVL